MKPRPVPRTHSRTSSWAKNARSHRAPQPSPRQDSRSTRSAPTKTAIGFVSLAATIAGGVHAVPYQGIQCTLPNAKSGQYGGVRNFWMVTKGPKKGEAAKFINWVPVRQQDGSVDHHLRAGSRSSDIRASPPSRPQTLPGDGKRARLSHAQDTRLGHGKDGPARRAGARRAGGCGARRDRGDARHGRDQSVAVVLAQRVAVVRTRGRRRRTVAGDGRKQAAAGTLDLLLPCLAADLGNAVDDRRGGADRARRLDARRRLPDRVRAPVGPAGARPGDPPARGGALGHLRADRNPRDRAVHRQPPDQQQPQGIGGLRRPAQRQQPHDRDLDPDADDPADHGRDQCQRAHLGTGILA